ncbi:enoyl-CoA hydratase/isomerase family protein [Pusillimonas sp. ANT_WB101]|uniref:enoyl-CoA hydratase/isomerase family protein n=1 Tax=Pusillimonas sp. ANT_WB101 TaxID=2597356 RepID=UPI0011EBEC5A|nr:enoyl-CoA hydratase/isomerase family protein [Pusillimonas sp. ANT_WB101]KAA0892641.1 enoyl-CoA hydratase/isomerase family protein [Pusillimonas sp. ANT_WB101]
MSNDSKQANKKYTCIVVAVEKNVAVIMLNRPEQLNAINFTMADEIQHAVSDLGWRPDVRVLVFKGAGRSFCAGYDVTTQRSEGTPREKMFDAQRVSSMLELIGRAPVVRIAQLHGHVVGAGLAMALQCHLRYAASNTTFALPELDFGIPFLLGGASLLTREVGPVRAADMILNCTVLPVDHRDAGRLVTEIVSDNSLEDRVHDVAINLGKRSEALLLATINTIDRANNDLLPPAPSDMFHGFFVRNDPETRQVGAEYVKKLKQKRH